MRRMCMAFSLWYGARALVHISAVHTSLPVFSSLAGRVQFHIYERGVVVLLWPCALPHTVLWMIGAGAGYRSEE